MTDDTRRQALIANYPQAKADADIRRWDEEHGFAPPSATDNRAMQMQVGAQNAAAAYPTAFEAEGLRNASDLLPKMSDGWNDLRDDIVERQERQFITELHGRQVELSKREPWWLPAAKWLQRLDAR